MTSAASQAAAAADRLLAARRGAGAVPARDVLPGDLQQAYAVQDATLARLGPIGGWKVGAKGPQHVPICAPLPMAGLLPSGSALRGPTWQLRGVEVELALRLGRDLDPLPSGLSPAVLLAAFDAVLPAIEIVETRLIDGRSAPALAQLADLQSHGALVLGAARPLVPRQPGAPAQGLDPAALDLRQLQARLVFDGQQVASTRGGNPAAELLRLLQWLAVHCAQRGLPLRAGQIITTGSCTGLLFAPAGALVQADLVGIGSVALQF